MQYRSELGIKSNQWQLCAILCTTDGHGGGHGERKKFEEFRVRLATYAQNMYSIEMNARTE